MITQIFLSHFHEVDNLIVSLSLGGVQTPLLHDLLQEDVVLLEAGEPGLSLSGADVVKFERIPGSSTCSGPRHGGRSGGGGETLTPSVSSDDESGEEVLSAGLSVVVGK